MGGFVDALGVYAIDLEHACADLQNMWMDVHPGDNQSLKHDEMGETLNIALSCVDMVVGDLKKVEEEYYASPRAELQEIKLPMPAILQNLQNVAKVLEAVKTEIV